MKIITRLAAVLSLVVTSACASMGSAGESYRNDSGLRAMIVPGGGGYGEALSFQINRPAYTALFRIVPGLGASMMYPRPGYGSGDGYLYSGMHRVMDSWGSRQFGSLARNNASQIYDNRYPGQYGGESGPEFYLLIASEEPLDLNRAGLYGYSGSFSPFFSSMSGYSAMEELVSTVVPNPNSDNWTTDYYIDWPQQQLYGTPQQGLVSVSCNGRTVYVNPAVIEEATRALCESGNVQTPNPNPNPSDSTGVVQPRRRAPVPAASERLSSSQLESPERFEAARRGAVEGRTLLLEEEAAREAAAREAEQAREEMMERMRRQREIEDAYNTSQPRRRPSVDDNSPPQAREPQPAYEPPPSRPEPRNDPPPSNDGGGGGEPRERPTL